MGIGGAATTVFCPPPQTAVLLITFDFAVGTNNFMSLIDRAFETRRRNPVVVKMHAEAVIKIDAHLDRVISVDAVAQEALFLAYRRERHGFGLVIMANQVDPM